MLRLKLIHVSKSRPWGSIRSYMKISLFFISDCNVTNILANNNTFFKWKLRCHWIKTCDSMTFVKEDRPLVTLWVTIYMMCFIYHMEECQCYYWTSFGKPIMAKFTFKLMHYQGDRSWFHVTANCVILKSVVNYILHIWRIRGYYDSMLKPPTV